MNSVVHGIAVYGFLWLIFRVAGKRTLSETTTFDFVLLLIMSECVQNALVDSDSSFTNAALLIITLVGVDILMSEFSTKSSLLNRLINSRPALVVDNGEPIAKQMRRSRLQVEDILAAAREKHGLERMNQIKFAVLEQNGGISIIPFDKK